MGTLALAGAGGYLLGPIPFGVILTRAAGAGDVRNIGSGNIGATNVLRTGRKDLAVASLLAPVLVAARVVQGAPRIALLGPKTRSLGALLALLGKAKLFVGSDSGPMHLASLMGRPSVVLFGPTDPIENAPFPGVPSRLLRVDVGCNPCREGCPARSCMAALGTAAVVRAAVGLLTRGS